MTGPAGSTAALTATYAAQQAATRASLIAFLTALFGRLTAWRTADATAFAAQAAPAVTGTQQRTAQLTAAYLNRVIALAGGVPAPPGVGRVDDHALRGVPAKQVYQRPFEQIWTDLSKGRDLQGAVTSAEARLRSIAATDVQLAKTHTSRRVLDGAGGVVGYRRVLTGDHSCALCLVASTQRYHKADLLPIHPMCDCSIEPIVGSHDPGTVIDAALLNQIHNTIRSQLGPQYVDSGARSPQDYRKVLIVHEHGELGPVLSVNGQAFNGPGDLTGPTPAGARSPQR